MVAVGIPIIALNASQSKKNSFKWSNNAVKIYSTLSL